MNYQHILVTGGAGFVGSNVCISLKKKYPNTQIIAFDNLKRRGSELNLKRFKKHGVEFFHGDVRHKEDLFEVKQVDLIIECSAEPSVLAGIDSSIDYLINTNLFGAIHCLELARIKQADFIFLSTSRVYSIEDLNNLNYVEEETRFTLSSNQTTSGASQYGISEQFAVHHPRSLYGTTKLSAEYFLQEYINTFNIRGVINRFGVICGPWQMGKIDQGIAVFWLANHYFKKDLSYIGFEGQGKQVRDFLDIDDLLSLIDIELNDLNKFNGKTLNAGGGIKNSASLQELTELCQEITGNKIPIKKVFDTRPSDLKSYVTDNRYAQSLSGWTPKKTLTDTFGDIFTWIKQNEKELKNIFSL